MAAIELDQSRPEALTFETSRYEDGDIILSGVVIYNKSEAELELDAKGQSIDPNPFLGADLHIEELRFDAPRLDADENFILDGMSMTGLALLGHSTEAVLSLDSLRVDGTSPEFAAVIGEALSVPSGGSEDVDLDGEGLVAEEVVLSGLLLSGVDDQGTDVRMRIDDIRLAYDAEAASSRFVLRELNIDTVTAEQAAVGFRAAELRLEGIDTETFGAWGNLIEQEDEQGFIQDYFQTVMLEPGEMFSLLNIRDVTLTAPGVALALDALTVSNEVNGDITRSRTRMNGLSLVPDAEDKQGAPVAAGLAQMGYEQVTLQAEFNTLYDAENGRVWTEGDNFYRLDDGFRLDVASDTSGYGQLAQVLAVASEADREDPLASQAIGQAVLSAFRINEISLMLTDESLLTRVITRMSDEQQMSQEDARAQLAGAAGLMALGMTQSMGPDFGMQANRALMGFIQDGGSITVSLAPEGEPTIMEMLIPDSKSGAMNFDAMGLSVTHTPPSD